MNHIYIYIKGTSLDYEVRNCNNHWTIKHEIFYGEYLAPKRIFSLKEKMFYNLFKNFIFCSTNFLCYCFISIIDRCFHFAVFRVFLFHVPRLDIVTLILRRWVIYLFVFHKIVCCLTPSFHSAWLHISILLYFRH